MTEQTEDSATKDSASENGAAESSETRKTATHDNATDNSQPEVGAVADEVDFVAAERLIFFTDAVAAIAMTLLAFDLRSPDITAKMSNGQALAALWEQNRLYYVAFLISFMVIGSHWRAHHQLFRNVSRLDA